MSSLRSGGNVSEGLEKGLFDLAHIKFQEECKSVKQPKQSYPKAKVVLDPINLGDLLRMVVFLPYILVVAWGAGPVLSDGFIYDGGDGGLNIILIAIPLWALLSTK